MSAAVEERTPIDGTVTNSAAVAAVPARIGADMLAAAGEVNRYHAQRLAEYRLERWPGPGDKAPVQQDADRA